MQRQCGNKNWKNVSKTYWWAFSKKQQVPKNIQQEPNVINMIKSYNNRISTEKKAQGQPKCKWWQKDTCPVEINCLDKELICRCKLKENTTSNGVKCNGLTDNTFKDRFYKHCSSFKYESKAVRRNIYIYTYIYVYNIYRYID